jgi:hypothetical protein
MCGAMVTQCAYGALHAPVAGTVGGCASNNGYVVSCRHFHEKLVI